MTGTDNRSVSSQYWRRTAASIPAANTRDAIEQSLRTYVQSWNEGDVRTRISLFADDVVFEDPATVTRATDRTELDSFFGGAIPADWVLAFGFVRSSVVGDEAILTYTVRLTIADRSPSELFVNSHVRVNADGLIESMRVFYDAESITDF